MMKLIVRNMKSFCINLKLLKVRLEVGDCSGSASCSCSEIRSSDFVWIKDPGKLCGGVDLFFSASLCKSWWSYWDSDNQNYMIL